MLLLYTNNKKKIKINWFKVNKIKQKINSTIQINNLFLNLWLKKIYLINIQEYNQLALVKGKTSLKTKIYLLKIKVKIIPRHVKKLKWNLLWAVIIIRKKIEKKKKFILEINKIKIEQVIILVVIFKEKLLKFIEKIKVKIIIIIILM